MSKRYFKESTREIIYYYRYYGIDMEYWKWWSARCEEISTAAHLFTIFDKLVLWILGPSELNEEQINNIKSVVVTKEETAETGFWLSAYVRDAAIEFIQEREMWIR
jgi:hypothetical protein